MKPSTEHQPLKNGFRDGEGTYMNQGKRTKLQHLIYKEETHGEKD